MTSAEPEPDGPRNSSHSHVLTLHTTSSLNRYLASRFFILKFRPGFWGVGTLVDSPTAYFSSERLSIGLASREPFKSSRGRCSLCRSSI